MPETSGPDPAELERSYQQILKEQAWQLDVPGEADERNEAEPEVSRRPPSKLRAGRSARREPPPVRQLLEALLFVGGPPLTPERAAEAVRGLTPEQFAQVIDEMNDSYRSQGRPYFIRRQEQGYALTLRPAYGFVMKRFEAGIREARLSGPAVDVLAIVAYRQPVTRREIEALRGHESGLVLRQLLRRALIAVLSRGEAGGREIHYGTTPRFLELFGLKTLDDLPQTEDLQRL